MAKDNLPVTAAIRVLREHGVPYIGHVYDYEPRGGTASSAQLLGVDEHLVIKTLVMQDETTRALVVLMHGDREVSTKALARHLGVKSIAPCTPEVADRHSGYQVGGTSPLGLRRAMPIYMERSIASLPRIFVNGGRRGMPPARNAVRESSSIPRISSACSGPCSWMSPPAGVDGVDGTG